MMKWYPIGPYGTTVSLYMLLHLPVPGVQMSFELDPEPSDETEDITVYTTDDGDRMFS